MSTDKFTNGSVSSRLLETINDKMDGNVKKYAENAGINPVTLFNYTKGRLPGTETLINICETYSVNLNWLLTGKGEKYLDEGGDKLHKPAEGHPELKDFLDWVDELFANDPRRGAWLEYELRDRIQLYQDWLKKRDRESEDGDRRCA